MLLMVLLHMGCHICLPCDGVIFLTSKRCNSSIFIFTLTSCPPPSDSLQQLFALPASYGGLDIFIPVITSNSESHCIAEPLCLCTLDHSENFTEALSFQQSRKCLYAKQS